MARLRPLYPSDRDLQVSDKEKAALRGSQGGAQTGTAWGSALGGIGGAGLGLLGLIGGPALAAATIPAGAAAGAGIGGAIGGSIGGASDQANADEAEHYGLARKGRLNEFQQRKAALDAFLKRGG